MPRGHVGAHDGLGVLDLLGEAARLQQKVECAVQATDIGQASCEDAQRRGLLGPGADRPGGRDRRLGARNGLLGPSAQQQPVGASAEHAGDLGRGWRPGHQPLGLREGGQRAGFVAGDPAVGPQAGQQDRGPDRLGDRVHLAEGVLEQPDRVPGRAGEGDRLGRPGQQLDPVQSGWPARVGHPLPQLQRALVVPGGLGEGAGALGGQPGLDPGRQRPGGLTGRVPMGGQLGGGHRRCAGGQVRLLGQGVGVAGVQPGPLAGQQVSVHDLP